MLKIAHISSVIDGRSNSGTARVARETISEIALSGSAYQYLIHFEPSSDPIYSLPNVTEILIPITNTGYGSRFRAFVKFWLKSRFHNDFPKFDVVHWHSSRVYPLFFLIPSRVTVITLYDAGQRILKGVNTFSTRLFYWNLRLFNYFVDVILASSSAAARDLIEIARFSSKKVDYLYHGTRFGHISPSKIPDFNLPPNFYVCISRWQPHKNVSQLVRSVHLLREAHREIVPIVLVGKPVGTFREPMDLIEKFELSKYFIILHDLSDSQLAFLLDHASLNIFPSLHEGFGLSVVEGMSRGCTPVVHINTATSEVAGRFGIRVDMTDPTALSQVLQTQATRNIELSISMKNYVASLFNWSEISKSLINIYYDALKVTK